LESSNMLFKNNYAYRLALANTDLDKAERLIKQVLEKNPNESHFIDTYGYILFQQKKYEEALREFEKALALNQNDKHIIEHVGDAQFKVGKVNEALANWKKAKELGATNLKLNDKINSKQYYEPSY
jgi:tetratricopeptide (TPR) repeat protein